MKTDENGPIDAVITWVDGAAPEHRTRRARFMARQAGVLSENARNPHRWEASDEITYCLWSIHHHAPWLRWIWIVAEQGAPELGNLPETLRKRVRIVRHEEIFAGYEHLLPTFNSLSLESMLWRIEGLSERFLYFNDDVFLTAPLRPDDMFEGAAPVLRGEWRDYSALASDTQARRDPARFGHVMQINAAALDGLDPRAVFSAAHVVHPMRRAVMALLFDRHRAAFERNIAFRFRDLTQFLPQALHNQYCMAHGKVCFAAPVDHLHIRSGQGTDAPPDLTRALLLGSALEGVRFLCVNDLPQLEALVPDARALIAQAVGGVALSG